MRATISIPVGLAYGDGEAVPDMPQGLTIADAIYHTVHSYPGGVAALAARMGVSANTLQHKANPNNTTHYMHPQELVALQHMSGNYSVLTAMASALGYVAKPADPAPADGDMVEVSMLLQVAFAELVRAVADPLARTRAKPGDAVTGNEMRRAEYHAQELHAAIGHMLATMRGSMRSAPKADA